MSWHFLQGQEEASWAGSSSDGAPSALLNLIPTAGECCLPDSATDCLNDSRYGMTFARSTDGNGEAMSALCPLASHARECQQRAKAAVLTIRARVSGAKSRALSVKYDRATSSWRTVRCLFPEDSIESLPTLPRWGSMRDGELWELTMPAGLIGERGSGLRRIWATPRASDGMKHRLRSLPKGHNCRARLEDEIAELHGEGGYVNPHWVEWLMGLPIGWTSLDPLPPELMAQWRDPAWWEADPADSGMIPRVSVGEKNRVGQLKALGNAQVPLCAATAWNLLAPA